MATLETALQEVLGSGWRRGDRRLRIPDAIRPRPREPDVMLPAHTARIFCRVHPALLDAFMRACYRRGVPYSEVLRGLMSSYVADDVSE